MSSPLLNCERFEYPVILVSVADCSSPNGTDDYLNEENLVESQDTSVSSQAMFISQSL